MKNKKILALLLACTIMASGVPVYAADFSDGTAESVQDAESSLFGMEDSELTEDTMPAFADMEENADAAQITDGNSEEEDLTGDKTEDKGTEGLEYEYVPEIDGYRVKKGVNEKEIRIPEKYEGKEVLEIGEGAFAGCDQIERIRILDHHKNFKIKKDAFENCISLRKVSFFGGIKVESGAFRNCPKLYDFALINYYEGTEVSIADDAFDADSKVLVSADGGLPWKGSPEPFFNENGEDGWHEKEQGMDYWDYVKNNGPSQYEGTRVADFDNSVSKVRIRDNVKGIGRKAFYGSDRLEEVRLGKENYFIESKAFAKCKNMSIIMPSGITAISDDAFDGASGITIYADKGSYAEKYAKKHNLTCKTIPAPTAVPVPKLKVSYDAKNGNATLNWTPVEYTFQYYIYRYDTATKKYKCVSKVDQNTTSYKPESSAGRTVKYKVRVRTLAGIYTDQYSKKSNTVTVQGRPGNVSDVSKKKKGKNLTFKWTKAKGAQGYILYRYDENARKYRKIKTIKNGNVTSYTDKTGKLNKNENYYVRAYCTTKDGTRLYGWYWA